jgi:hypothetical protein
LKAEPKSLRSYKSTEERGQNTIAKVIIRDFDI